ncbi:hypothetical protein AB0J63_26770 [Streptosporangium canum]|uniref:helix-turn-helix domain-containing protein n=1 Tax=Streptosporangium canum TaxID=324952 RepID=UPI0034374A2C
MGQIDNRRNALGLPKSAVTSQLGHTAHTLRSWADGKSSPRFSFVVAYAGLLAARIVLTRDGREVAEGVDIIAALPELRRTSGVTHQQMARRLYVSHKGVSRFETRGGTRYLSSVERYASALDLRVELAEIAAAEVAS